MAGKEPKAWITVNGVHVPIFEGQSKEEAVKAHLAKRVRNDDSGKERQIAQSKQEAEKKTADEPVQLKDNTDYDQFIRDNIKVLRTSHKSMDEIKQDWYELRHNAEIKNLDPASDCFLGLFFPDNSCHEIWPVPCTGKFRRPYFIAACFIRNLLLRFQAARHK